MRVVSNWLMQVAGDFGVAFSVCVKSSLCAKSFIRKLVPPKGALLCTSNLYCTGTRFKTEAQGNSEVAYYWYVLQPIRSNTLLGQPIKSKKKTIEDTWINPMVQCTLQHSRMTDTCFPALGGGCLFIGLLAFVVIGRIALRLGLVYRVII